MKAAYHIYRGAFAAHEVPLVTLQSLYSRAQRIFNDNETIPVSDGRRKQVAITSRIRKRQPDLDAFLERLQRFFRDNGLMEQRRDPEWVLLISMAGCQRQMAHCDYSKTPKLTQALQNGQVPLLALVAIMPDTKLVLWPKSVGCFDAPTIRMRYDDHTIIHLDVGDVLIFRADVIHAGHEYDTEHLRLHAFLDHDRVFRAPNTTYKVRLDGDFGVAAPIS